MVSLSVGSSKALSDFTTLHFFVDATSSYAQLVAFDCACCTLQLERAIASLFSTLWQSEVSKPDQTRLHEQFCSRRTSSQ
jgi:hypothetical protein